MNLEYELARKLFGFYDAGQTARMLGVTPVHLRVIRKRTGLPRARIIGRDRFFRGIDIIIAALDRYNQQNQPQPHTENRNK